MLYFKYNWNEFLEKHGWYFSGQQSNTQYFPCHISSWKMYFRLSFFFFVLVNYGFISYKYTGRAIFDSLDLWYCLVNWETGPSQGD